MTRARPDADSTRHVLRLVRNTVICNNHHRLTLSTTTFPPARPGQFVHLRPCSVGVVGEGAGPFLRRAFSIGGLRRTDAKYEIDVLFRVVGAGTRWLGGLRLNDTVDALGPVGNTFPEPPEGKTVWLVAGGIGLPPLLWFAQELGAQGREFTLFAGARNRGSIPLAFTQQRGAFIADDAPQGELVVATDDGGVGFAGTVVDAVNWRARDSRVDLAGVVVYACGPEAMLRAVAAFCADRSVECYVCLERAMACGVGTCQSCVVPVTDPGDAEGWRYALCCTEGPVFRAGHVVWER